MNKVANLYHTVYGDPRKGDHNSYARDTALVMTGATAGGILDKLLTPRREIKVTIPANEAANPFAGLFKKVVKETPK